MVTSNPDFDIFVLNHNEKYKNQDKLTFIKDNYKYKTIETFKNDKSIFEKFNPNSKEYQNVCSRFDPKKYIITNKYIFEQNKYSFRSMAIIYNKDNEIYKISNINDLFKIL